MMHGPAGVQVRPQVLVRVSADPSSGSVTFSSETATLGESGPTLEAFAVFLFVFLLRNRMPAARPQATRRKNRELALRLRATLSKWQKTETPEGSVQVAGDPALDNQLALQLRVTLDRVGRGFYSPNNPKPNLRRPGARQGAGAAAAHDAGQSEALRVPFPSEIVVRTAGDPALDKELALQLRATLGGVPAGDRAAFRRLARRRPPAWAPHPQPGAAADAIDAPEAAAAAAPAQAAETAGSAGLAAAEAAPAVADPLASVEDFRPLQPEAIKAAMAGSPPCGAVSAHVADNGGSGGADAAASSGSGGIAGSSGNGAAVDIAMAVDSGGGGCKSSILVADRSGNGAAEQPPHAGADAAAASDSAASGAVAANAAGNTALSVAESTPQQLAARVDLRVSLNVPPVLRVVPGPLLGYASKLLPFPLLDACAGAYPLCLLRLCLFP